MARVRSSIQRIVEIAVPKPFADVLELSEDGKAHKGPSPERLVRIELVTPRHTGFRVGGFTKPCDLPTIILATLLKGDMR